MFEMTHPTRTTQRAHDSVDCGILPACDKICYYMLALFVDAEENAIRRRGKKIVKRRYYRKILTDRNGASATRKGQDIQVLC